MDLRLMIKQKDQLIFQLTSLKLVDADKLFPSLKNAQEIEIRRVLTDELYERILQEYIDGGLADTYLTIHEEYVKPMLIFYAAADFIMENEIDIANAGNFQNQPDKQLAAETNRIERKAKKYIDRAVHYELKFKKFIAKNPVAEYKPDSEMESKSSGTKFNWYSK